MELYPLKEKQPHLVKSRSGKHLDDINIKGIMDGSVTSDDIKISRDVLIYQAEVARLDGKIQLAKNFIRASELIEVPDDRILEIYNMLRPNRSTREELENLSKELRDKYSASINADLVDETLKVYIKRDLLKV